MKVVVLALLICLFSVCVCEYRNPLIHKISNYCSGGETNGVTLVGNCPWNKIIPIENIESAVDLVMGNITIGSNIIYTNEGPYPCIFAISTPPSDVIGYYPGPYANIFGSCLNNVFKDQIYEKISSVTINYNGSNLEFGFMATKNITTYFHDNTKPIHWLVMYQLDISKIYPLYNQSYRFTCLPSGRVLFMGLTLIYSSLIIDSCDVKYNADTYLYMSSSLILYGNTISKLSSWDPISVRFLVYTHGSSSIVMKNNIMFGSLYVQYNDEDIVYVLQDHPSYIIDRSECYNNSIYIYNNTMNTNRADIVVIDSTSHECFYSSVIVSNNIFQCVFEMSLSFYIGLPLISPTIGDLVHSNLLVRLAFINGTTQITDNKFVMYDVPDDMNRWKTPYTLFPTGTAYISAITLEYIICNNTKPVLLNNEVGYGYYQFGIVCLAPDLDVFFVGNRTGDYQSVPKYLFKVNPLIQSSHDLIMTRFLPEIIQDYPFVHINLGNLFYDPTGDYTNNIYKVIDMNPPNLLRCNMSLSVHQHDGCIVDVIAYNTDHICNEITIFKNFDRAVLYCSGRAGYRQLMLPNGIVTPSADMYWVNNGDYTFDIIGNGGPFETDHIYISSYLYSRFNVYISGNLRLLKVNILRSLDYGEFSTILSNYDGHTVTNRTIEFNECTIKCTTSFSSYCSVFSEDVDYGYRTIKHYNTTIATASNLFMSELNYLEIEHGSYTNIRGGFINSYIYDGFSIKGAYIEMITLGVFHNGALNLELGFYSFDVSVQILFSMCSLGCIFRDNIITIEVDKSAYTFWYNDARIRKYFTTYGASVAVHFVNTMIPYGNNTGISWPSTEISNNKFRGFSAGIVLYYGDMSGWDMEEKYRDENYAYYRSKLDTYRSTACNYTQLQSLYYANMDMMSFVFNVTCINLERNLFQTCINGKFCRVYEQPEESCLVSHSANEANARYGQSIFNTIEDALHYCTSPYHEGYYDISYIGLPKLLIHLDCGEHVYKSSFQSGFGLTVVVNQYMQQGYFPWGDLSTILQRWSSRPTWSLEIVGVCNSSSIIMDSNDNGYLKGDIIIGSTERSNAAFGHFALANMSLISSGKYNRPMVWFASFGSASVDNIVAIGHGSNDFMYISVCWYSTPTEVIKGMNNREVRIIDNHITNFTRGFYVYDNFMSQTQYARLGTELYITTNRGYSIVNMFNIVGVFSMEITDNTCVHNCGARIQGTLLNADVVKQEVSIMKISYDKLPQEPITNTLVQSVSMVITNNNMCGFSKSNVVTNSKQLYFSGIWLNNFQPALINVNTGDISISNNTVCGFDVGMRLSTVDVSFLMYNRLGIEPLQYDGRTELREMARLNSITSYYYDVLRGGISSDYFIKRVDYCNNLCPVLYSPYQGEPLPSHFCKVGYYTAASTGWNTNLFASINTAFRNCEYVYSGTVYIRLDYGVIVNENIVIDGLFQYNKVLIITAEYSETNRPKLVGNHIFNNNVHINTIKFYNMHFSGSNGFNGAIIKGFDTNYSLSIVQCGFYNSPNFASYSGSNLMDVSFYSNTSTLTFVYNDVGLYGSTSTLLDIKNGNVVVINNTFSTYSAPYMKSTPNTFIMSGNTFSMCNIVVFSEYCFLFDNVPINTLLSENTFSAGYFDFLEGMSRNFSFMLLRYDMVLKKSNPFQQSLVETGITGISKNHMLNNKIPIFVRILCKWDFVDVDTLIKQKSILITAAKKNTDVLYTLASFVWDYPDINTTLVKDYYMCGSDCVSNYTSDWYKVLLVSCGVIVFICFIVIVYCCERYYSPNRMDYSKLD